MQRESPDLAEGVMVEPRYYDVAIVGAGIAGSALAVALSGEGLSIALVEAQPLTRVALPAGLALDSFDPRVSALTPRSQALLNNLGAWGSIAGYRSCPYRHMTVWDAEGTGQVEFDCAEVDAEQLGYIVENRSIVDALVAQIETADDVSVLSPARLQACNRQASGRMVLSMEDGLSLQAGLIVAADGAQSRVREMMNFRLREWDYGHHGIVCTVQFEKFHEETAWQRFLPSGPLALLPLSGSAEQHFCSIVWSLQDERVDTVMAMDDQAFCRALEQASEMRLGKVTGCTRRFAFPLRQRHAREYVQQGVALVADAAHTIHPLAGQGINLGLQDVAVLAREVLKGYRRGISPGQLDLLQRYQRQRKGENLLMMSTMEGFKRLFEQEALPLRWLRNAGLHTVDRLRPVKRELMRRAMGVA